MVYIFQYIDNFQCSSAVMATFGPVLLYAYGISLIMSLSLIVMSSFRQFFEPVFNKLPKYCILFLPPILRNEEFHKSVSALQTPLIIANFLEHIVLLLSFGFCVPYIAIVVGISAAALWLKHVVLERQFAARHVGPYKGIAQPQRLLLQHWSKGLREVNITVLWAMVYVGSAVLVSLTLFDVAADDNSLNLECIALFPLLVLFFPGIVCLLRAYGTRDNFNKLWACMLCSPQPEAETAPEPRGRDVLSPLPHFAHGGQERVGNSTSINSGSGSGSSASNGNIADAMSEPDFESAGEGSRESGAKSRESGFKFRESNDTEDDRGRSTLVLEMRPSEKSF
jgi:hypothetical protein